MTDVYLVLGAAGVFLVMGVFLLFGKGSWLIAGYNTATPEEKAKYDRKKLCRATGVLCEIICAMLGAMAYFGWRVETGKMAENKMLLFAAVFIAVVVTGVVLMSCYINKHVKRK